MFSKEIKKHFRAPQHDVIRHGLSTALKRHLKGLINVGSKWENNVGDLKSVFAFG